MSKFVKLARPDNTYIIINIDKIYEIYFKFDGTPVLCMPSNTEIRLTKEQFEKLAEILEVQ